MKSRYKNRRLPDLDDPARTDDPFDEFNIEHDASGRAFDLWEAPSPDDAVFQRELRDALDRGLASLDLRQEVWIRLYYGIPFSAETLRQYSTAARSIFPRHVYQRNAQSVLHVYPRTLEEIGQMFGCTGENVRRVVADGLKKLRHYRHALRDVLHPELEETRRTSKERRKLDARRRVRKVSTKRGANTSRFRSTTSHRRQITPEQAAGAHRPAAPISVDIHYQILAKEHLPNYVREPLRARLARERAVGKYQSDMAEYGAPKGPWANWHPYKQPDIVCGVCGDEYLSKLEKYDPPVYLCYRCRRSVPVILRG